MGDVTRILITGAGGFIGRATVRAARDAGLGVTALVRKNIPQDWVGDDGITPVQLDLTAPEASAKLPALLSDAYAVIHLAAALSSDPKMVQSQTIDATDTLARALENHPVVRVVLASSIAVYDYLRVSPGDTLTEASALGQFDLASNAYAFGKLAQERRLAGLDNALSILRPGIVYDRDLNNAHLGVGIGPVLIRIGGGGEVPLCHVDHCAQGLVQAALSDAPITANLLDRGLPTRAQIIEKMQAHGWPKLSFPLHWRVLDAISGAARVLGPHRLPGLLHQQILRQRLMPLRYQSSFQPEGTA